jgi:hypothetical protein
MARLQAAVYSKRAIGESLRPPDRPRQLVSASTETLNPKTPEKI